MTVPQLLSILSSQKEELATGASNSLVSRYEEPLIYLGSKMAQVVIGVRRSGKSTLCLKVLSERVGSFAYVNFDDERLASLRADELDTLLEALYRIYGDFEYLFMDEIQNIDGWQLFVNRLLRQKIHIILTGSNSKLLSSELMTHLTGRHNRINLYPFSFSEYCDIKGVDKRAYSARARALRKVALESYMKDGGFPELIAENNRKGYISGLLDSIINTDIARRFKIRHKDALRRMATFLSDNYCQEFVAKDVAAEFGISDHTAENYYSYLKQAFLLVGINKFSYKSKERIRNEKIYVVDTALATDKVGTVASAGLGWRLENIVCIELMRRNKPFYKDLFYFRTPGHEVDFVVADGGRPEELIQVSYDISAEKTKNREIAGLIAGAKALKCNKLTLITFDDTDTIVKDGYAINVVSAIDWLCERTQVNVQP